LQNRQKKAFFMKYRSILYLLFIVLCMSSCGASKQSSQKYSNKEVERVIKYASGFIGTPYKYAGTTTKGFDCSGYVQYVFKEFNYRLPRNTDGQSKTGTPVNKKDIKPGDLVFFTGRDNRSKKVGHVGIVVDSDRKENFIFIHASTSKGVTVTSSLETYYKSRYLLARRIVKN